MHKHIRCDVVDASAARLKYQKLQNVFMGVFSDILGALAGGKPSNQKKIDENDSEQESKSQGAVYKCSQCGKSPLSGPVLYCDGCGQYMCYTCGVPSGDMIFDCPNCAIQTERVNL